MYIMGSKSGNKRLRPETDSGSEDEQLSSIFDKFLLIESLEKNKNFSNVSPFIIEKTLFGKIGTTENVKKLKDGKLLVQLLRKKQSVNLQKLDEFCDLKVKVYPHKTLNTSKGVIRDRRLYCCSEEEIKENLASQGVTNVRRIKIKKDKEMKPTNTLILTFNTPSRPNKLKIFYQFINVTPYIPNPLRCFDCQKFGHHENNCRNTLVCGHCAGVGDHHEGSCKNPAKCANCGEPHPANSNKCSVWKKEKEITRIKFTNNISYPEARKLVENIPTQTYSSIVKSGAKTVEMKDAQTQTSDASTQTPESTVQSSTSTTAVQQKTANTMPETGKKKQAGNTGQSSGQTPSRQKDSAKKPVVKTGQTPGRNRGSSNGTLKSANRFEALSEGARDEMDCELSSPSPREPRPRSVSPILPPT